MLGSIDKGAVSGYNRHRTAGYSLLPITFVGHSDVFAILQGGEFDNIRIPIYGTSS